MSMPHRGFGYQRSQELAHPELVEWAFLLTFVDCASYVARIRFREEGTASTSRYWLRKIVCLSWSQQHTRHKFAVESPGDFRFESANPPHNEGSLKEKRWNRDINFFPGCQVACREGNRSERKAKTRGS